MGGVCGWICSFFLGVDQLDDDGAGVSGPVDGGISASGSGSVVTDLVAAAEFFVVCRAGFGAWHRVSGKGAVFSPGVCVLCDRVDSGGRMAESGSEGCGGVGRIPGDFG